MTYHATTPFGQRPVTAALIEHANRARETPALPSIDKWELFRNLCTARAAFGVSSRDLTVLNALLSFHPPRTLDDDAQLIVFPSNASLADRAHGMAESTLRRHLAALVAAGLITRQDSPNGKRYAVRGVHGAPDRCYGFDLRLLLVRAAEISQAATAQEEQQAALKEMRDKATLLRRDGFKMLEYLRQSGSDGPLETLEADLAGTIRQMRRKLPLDALRGIVDLLDKIKARILRLLHTDTEKMSGKDAENERHYQNSKPYSSDSEPAQNDAEPEIQPDLSEPPLPLALVLKACPDLAPYTEGGCRHWPDLITVADKLRAMMGVSPSAWDEARRSMGPANAAVTLACILQRFGSINSPGGYLRSLSAKAATTGFSPGPMVMALLNGNTTGAAR